MVVTTRSKAALIDLTSGEAAQEEYIFTADDFGEETEEQELATRIIQVKQEFTELPENNYNFESMTAVNAYGGDGEDISQPEILIRVLSQDNSKKYVQCIHLHQEMNVNELERCIALNAYGNDDCVDRRVFAVFREFDGASISLSEILSSPQKFQGEVMTVLHPSQTKAFRNPNEQYLQPSPSKFSLPYIYVYIRDFLMLSLLAFFAYRAWESHDFLDDFNERAILSMIMSPIDLIDYTIEHPLRWIYRNGPPIVGWDGRSYPEICSAIIPDVAGIDPAFWYSNLDKCKQMYETKERAMLSKFKPLSYLLVATILFKFVLHWINVKAATRPDPR